MSPSVKILGFDFSPGGILSEILIEVAVCFPFDPANPAIGGNNSPLPRKIYTALWDTGATGSCITPRVVRELGLQPTGKIKCFHAQGESLVSKYVVNIGLPNNVEIPMIPVAEAAENGAFDVLIGMDIITQGDFLISNAGGRTIVSFQMPSTKRLTLRSLKDLLHNAPRPTIPAPLAPRFPNVGRNDPCPCGSGKKFKKCCGAFSGSN